MILLFSFQLIFALGIKTTFKHNQKRRRCPARAGFIENNNLQQQKAHPERINKEKRLSAPQSQGN